MTRGRAALAPAMLVGAWLGWLPAARADQPLAVPASRKIPAPAGNCWAYTDVDSKSTTAFKRGKGKASKLWSVPGWYRVAALAADCEHFVTGYDGGNLLPEQYDPDTVMLSFYAKGTLIRQVTLRELVKDLTKLQKTASHWSWGYYAGVERRTHYRVGTVDRGDIVFDMKTGLPIEQSGDPPRAGAGPAKTK
jgi:hypothetical protein